jgi:hypothetical protein
MGTMIPKILSFIYDIWLIYPYGNLFTIKLPKGIDTNL